MAVIPSARDIVLNPLNSQLFRTKSQQISLTNTGNSVRADTPMRTRANRVSAVKETEARTRVASARIVSLLPRCRENLNVLQGVTHVL